MPGNLILAIAKEYGQSPDQVETEWSAYWVNRAALKLEAESIDSQRRANDAKKRSRK